MSKSAYRIIGLMSGTSLDGLDIACCYFEEKNGSWNYKIKYASTEKYPEEWNKKLAAQQLPKKLY